MKNHLIFARDFLKYLLAWYRFLWALFFAVWGGKVVLFFCGKKVLVAIILLILFASCSTVKKSQNSIKNNTDISVVQSKTASDVKKSDSSGTKNVTGDYTKETLYKYDTVYQYLTVGGKIDTVLKYVPRILTVYETGNYNLQQTARQQTSDSNSISVAKQVSVLKNSEENIKTKEKTTAPLWLYLLLFIVGLAVIVFVYRKYFFV